MWWRNIQDGGGVRCGDHLPPQIPQKYIFMWNNSYRRPTEHGQKTSEFHKGKLISIWCIRTKEKDTRELDWKLCFWEGAVTETKFPHMDGDRVELCNLREECSNRFMEQKVERIQHRDSCQPAFSSLRYSSVCMPWWVGAGFWGLGFGDPTQGWGLVFTALTTVWRN